ncbi:MAG: hypothetical protein JWQ98_1364 [Chlorobi bacterium]|nr:hypothetical protein [Chlorobiota bacterium]
MMGDFLSRLAERTLDMAPVAKPLVAPAFARMSGRRENGLSSDDADNPPEREITREEHRITTYPPPAVGAVERPEAPAPPPAMPTTVAWTGLRTDREISSPIESRERAAGHTELPVEPIRRARREAEQVDDIAYDDRAGIEQPSPIAARRHDAIRDTPAPALPPLVPEQRQVVTGHAGVDDGIVAGDSHESVERRRKEKDDDPRDAADTGIRTEREQVTEPIRTIAVMQPLVPVEPQRTNPRIDRLEQRMAEERGRREEPAAAPAPTIQVTIGRIEVRATTTPAPAPRRERAGAQIMSIDDYLRQRTGGGGR